MKNGAEYMPDEMRLYKILPKPIEIIPDIAGFSKLWKNGISEPILLFTNRSDTINDAP